MKLLTFILAAACLLPAQSVLPILGRPSGPGFGFYLDAITGAGSDSANGLTPSTPWATLTHACATLSGGDTTTLGIKYPNGAYYSAVPGTIICGGSGFLSYYPMQECSFGGCTDSTVYDVYNGHNATLTSGSSPGGSALPQWKNSGLVINGFNYASVSGWGSIGPTTAASIIASGASYYCTAAANGACPSNPYIFFPVSLEDSSNRILTFMAAAQPNSGNAVFQYQNFSSGQITSSVSTGIVNTPHVWGFFAGNSYQAIFRDSTLLASQNSNLTHTATSSDLSIGVSKYASIPANSLISGLMIANNNPVSATDASVYNTLETWLSTTEAGRIIHAKAVTQTGSENVPSIGWHLGSITPTDADIRTIADYIVSSGLFAIWNSFQTPFLETDIGWATGRDSSGNIIVNATEFPNMPATSTYVQGKGLNFGLYFASTPGSAPSTGGCGSFNFPGSGGFETNDATFAASIGVKRIRYDLCQFLPGFPSNAAAQAAYQAMTSAVVATGTQMQFEVSFDGSPFQYADGTWCTTIGGTDLWAGSQTGSAWSDYLSNLDAQSGLATYMLAPRCWIAPSFLNIGSPAFSDNEFWSSVVTEALLSSPLIYSLQASDLPLSSNMLATMGNADVIAVDEDSAGVSGWRADSPSCGSGGGNVYVRPLHGGGWAIGYFNRDSSSCTINETFNNIIGDASTFNGANLRTQASLGALASYSVSVATHDTVLFALCPGATNWNFTTHGCQ